VTTHTHAVDGMSCENCAYAITGEVTKVPGVADVIVDLPGKTVAVTGQAFDETAARDAVDEETRCRPDLREGEGAQRAPDAG
jgi:copper chaperone